MLLNFIFCVYLVTSLSADDVSTSSSSSVVPIDKMIADLAAVCLSPEEFEQLVGNNLKYGSARHLAIFLVSESVATVGLQELRKSLKLPAPGPWKHLNRTEPSEHELESATIQDYYELKEPRNKRRSLDSEWLFEHNVHTAIDFFDKRLPEIRTVFRRTFEENIPEVVDKKSIDRMIEVFRAILVRIHKSTNEILRNDECWPIW